MTKSPLAGMQYFDCVSASGSVYSGSYSRKVEMSKFIVFNVSMKILLNVLFVLLVIGLCFCEFFCTLSLIVNFQFLTASHFFLFISFLFIYLFIHLFIYLFILFDYVAPYLIMLYIVVLTFVFSKCDLH